MSADARRHSRVEAEPVRLGLEPPRAYLLAGETPQHTDEFAPAHPYARPARRRASEFVRALSDTIVRAL